MHVHTQGVSRERPDFVRRGERCWIDGDLIRLSSWPIGGIRPGGRAGPIPWLMDLSTLEEAMQEVYGRDFRLGDRAPLLQMTANALASGDRRRAADLANEVSFPPPDYASRLRNSGLRYLNWGPAHRRGNPPIDVDAWLERKAWERKYDPINRACRGAIPTAASGRMVLALEVMTPIRPENCSPTKNNKKSVGWPNGRGEFSLMAEIPTPSSSLPRVAKSHRSFRGRGGGRLHSSLNS